MLPWALFQKLPKLVLQERSRELFKELAHWAPSCQERRWHKLHPVLPRNNKPQIRAPMGHQALMDEVNLKASQIVALDRLLIQTSVTLPWKISPDLLNKCRPEPCPLFRERVRSLGRVHWPTEDGLQHKRSRLQDLVRLRIMGRPSA